ncbi:MAG TPA: rRNA maturation RNase YbeY [Nitrospiria bacterium]
MNGRGKPEGISIRVSNRDPGRRIRLGFFRDLAASVLLRSRKKQAEISLTFVTDRAMQRLNRDYRGQDRPTDVLAFDLSRAPEPGRARPVLNAEIVISTQTARRQAAGKRHSMTREISHLLIHGLLHVMGYDHMKPDEARRMARRERFLIRELLN